MLSPHRSAWLRRSAAIALLFGGLPFVLEAQIRRPDPSPTGATPAARRAAKRRTELLAGVGITGMNIANATESSLLTGSIGLRRQFSPEWLYLGGTLDFGSTKINGESFPYERRADGDSSRFFAVGGRATMVAARATADILWEAGDDNRARVGVGANLGMYAMMPSPAGGENAGTFVAPTFGAAIVGEFDLSRKLSLAGNFGFTQFTGFDRDKLRPSKSTGEDPVFGTPFQQPSDAVRSFGGIRVIVGLSYRVGVTQRRSRR
jgi:hypothetical protein